MQSKHDNKKLSELEHWEQGGFPYSKILIELYKYTLFFYKEVGYRSRTRLS